MKELIAGHKYELDNLHDNETKSVLTFYMDPALHKGQELVGPSTQEVLRACVMRVIALDKEEPNPINRNILQKLRECIGLFEARAVMRLAEKGYATENIPTLDNGHWFDPERLPL